MTSQKSSVNTFSNTFWYTVRNCLYAPAIVASVLLIGVMYLASYIGGTNEIVYDMYYGEKAASVGSDIKFFLLGTGYSLEETLFALHFVFALAAVILAVTIFKFINSKKTVNVWFGMGISKSKLFYAKLLGGVFLLGSMILLPALVDLIVNVLLFGFSYELLMSWLYLACGFIVYTLNIFLLFITVMCVAGTSVEGVVFGIILLFTPSLVYLEISEIMNTLTLGSQFGGNGDDLFISLMHYNPITFLAEASDFGNLMKSTEEASFEWSTPPFFPVILWLCVTALLAAVSGALFKRRKTEIAGFWGSSKVMTFVISLDAGLSAFCIGVSTAKIGKAAAIITGLLAAAAVFLIADILLTLNKREWVKNLKMLPVQSAILAAVGTVFATGLFGYSARIPDLNGVKEIAVTPVTYNGIMDVLNDYYSYGLRGIPSYGYYDAWNSQLTLSTENDKRKAAEIHRMFIKADIIEPHNTDTVAPRQEQILYSPVTIEYTKENGSKLKRHYDYVPMSVFKSYGELNFGDWYKNAVKEQMTEPVSAKDSEQVKLNKSFYQNEDNAVYLASKYLDNSYSLLRMTAEQRKNLLEAVAHDLINTSADVKQKPLTEQLATLVFTHDSIKVMDSEEGAYYESNYYETEGDFYDYKYNTSQYFYLTSEAPVKPAPGDQVWRHFSDGSQVSVMITEKMTETIAFLMNNGFSELLSYDADIVSARVMSISGLAKSDSETWYFLGGGYPPVIHFNGTFTNERVYEYFSESKEITDTSVIGKLKKISYGSYYTDEEFYYVCYEHAGGGYSVMCIPAKLMPKELVF